MFSSLLQTPVGRYLSMYRRRWPQVALCVTVALAQSFVLMPVYLFYRKMIDVCIPHKDVRQVVVLSCFAVGLYFANMGLAISQRYLTLKATKSVIYELRARVCTKLQELCLSYYDNTNVGNLHARAMIDTEQVDVSSNAMVSMVLVSITSFIIALAILFWMNVTLTLVLLGILPILYFCRLAVRKRVKDSHKQFRNQRESLSTSIHTLLNSIRLVKSFGMESVESEKLNTNIRDYLQSGIRMAFLSTLFGSMIATISGLGTASVWAVGAILAIKGQMTMGSVVAFAGLQGFLIGPINQLANMAETLYSGSTALKAVFDLLDEDAVEFPAEGQKVEQLEGRVQFQDVSFSYSDGTLALDKVSFAAEPGKQLALVGASGAGKSTLIHLILGLYLPTEGRVLIDGKDITDLELSSLRQQMGMVSQETILLEGTVRENICYGNPDASDDSIVWAAKQSYAHDFICNLPKSYDSVCGDDGVKLSGGQRQRLAIARALLRNPRLLILDEATSALDSESELQVQKAMDVLRKDRTTFVIAHRLSTILGSDTILVLKEGKIVERGTHAELLALGGVYTQLYNTQFRMDRYRMAQA